MLFRPPVLVVAILLLSGCAGTPTNLPSPSSTQGQGPADETTGSLQVFVVDAEVAPVFGAQVILSGTDYVATTDEFGGVLFTGLEPIPYTAVAAKAGFRAQQPQGRVAQVMAGEVAEVRLVLEPVVAVTAGTSYHTSYIFKGFVSCSIEWIRVSVLVNRSQCGKGVNVGSSNVGADTNENATHPWYVDNVQIQTLMLEAEWQPSIGATGSNLYFATQSAYTCAITSCQYNNEMQGGGGSSPVRVVTHEGGASNITGYFGDGATYPRQIWSVGRAYCTGSCVISATFQQSYELVASMFYGVPAPEGWSARGP
jgi:hypothetical protein